MAPGTHAQKGVDIFFLLEGMKFLGEQIQGMDARMQDSRAFGRHRSTCMPYSTVQDIDTWHTVPLRAEARSNCRARQPPGGPVRGAQAWKAMELNCIESSNVLHGTVHTSGRVSGQPRLGRVPVRGAGPGLAISDHVD